MKKHYYKIFLTVLLQCAFVMLQLSYSYAVDTFLDAQQTVYNNLNLLPNNYDSYYGGYDMHTPLAPLESGPTNLTFINSQNVYRIIGGSLSTPARPATVRGDTNIIVDNSSVNYIIGGGRSEVQNSIVTGLVNITVRNNSVINNRIYGAGIMTAGVYQDHVSVGGVNILIDNSTVHGTIYGSSDCVGIENNGRVAVFGNINIRVQNSPRIYKVVGTSDSSAHILGNLAITIDNTQNLDIIECIDHATLSGNVALTIQNNSTINRVYLCSTSPYGTGGIGGTIEFIVNDSTIQTCNLGPYGGVLNPAKITLHNATINQLDISPRKTQNGNSSGGTIKSATISMHGGLVTTLKLTPTHGVTNESKLNLYEGVITTLELGTHGAGYAEKADIEIFGGTINRIAWLPNGIRNSTLTFAPGAASYIHDITPGRFSKIVFQKDSLATLGVPGTPFTLEGQEIELGEDIIPHGTPFTLEGDNITIPNSVKIQQAYTIRCQNFTVTKKLGITNTGLNLDIQNLNIPGILDIQCAQYTLKSQTIDFSGEVILPRDKALLTLDVGQSFTADGGVFDLGMLNITDDTPHLHITGSPNCSLQIKKPLKIEFMLPDSLMPYQDALQLKEIPIVYINHPNLANENLFEPKITKGLLWCNISFDKNSSTWYIHSITPSEDYYGYTAARNALGWLRQNYLTATQNRSVSALNNKNHGFWTSLNSGYEKINTGLGKSTLPWGVINVGYTYIQPINSTFTALYGATVGYGIGAHKWDDYNTTKNRINTKILNVHSGISMPWGIYSMATVQYSMSQVRSKSQGFNTTTTWNESTPAGSLELGWWRPLGLGFILKPKAVIGVEHIPTKSIAFEYEGISETVIMKNNTTVSIDTGITLHYIFNPSSIIYTGVDVIKGIHGAYTSHSQIFDKLYSDDYNDTVLRLSLGYEVSLSKSIHITMDTFADIIDHKGLGAQIELSYIF